MKIGTWNVNGIRAREAQLREWIERDRPDVVCLQEIKAHSAQIPAALCEMEGYWCYWHGEKAYSGVGLHVRKEAFPQRPAFSHPAFDHENRIVVARMAPSAGGQPGPAAGPDLTVASIYVPNGGKDFPAKMRFLEAMAAYVGEVRASGGRLVLCGDLNVARTDMDVHPKERKPGLVGQRPEEREIFERILAAGVVDLTRSLHPGDDQIFTWWAPWRNLRQRNIGWRIDYILASEPLAGKATRCAVLAEVGTSDHAPVMAEFEEISDSLEAGNSDPSGGILAER